ncbi:class III poly(R)-hydroxyalkanoic acid synthase subunit PhaE [Luteimonas yindakuii]|uniref:Poly(3-hydroxyalkanoate) polymerase subunit PhaE n=2 Tax=Luteimonas yindakuii TaxID=2565782 RepID=A0A4Z1RKU2_9GAMM|nr:class III poly(R)-hydroxyalkanoic acid synthase subunit PhaE [Luteimonas yindakuii]
MIGPTSGGHMSHDASQQAFAAAAAEFDTLARRFWGTWGEAMRHGAAQGNGFGQPGFGTGWYATPGFASGGLGMPGFGPAGPADPAGWWANLAQAGAAQHAASRFDGLARQWYAQMQQLAARFAGHDGSAGDVVEAWKKMLANAGDNPFAQLLSNAQQQAGSLGPQAWMMQAAPWLQRMQGGAGELLQTPTFGFAREHQERWQALAQAQIGLTQKLEAYNALMGRVMQDALAIFERKLADREAPGLQIDSPRALFDLWIDAAEEAYAPVALGEEFRHVYAELVNAQMRVRQGVQREVEHACELFDMPTRSELDGAHRKIVELERQVRRLRDAVAQMSDGSRRTSASADGNGNDTAPEMARRKASGGSAPAKRAPARAQSKRGAAAPVRATSKAQAAAGPATGGAVPRGSRVAAGGGAAAGTRRKAPAGSGKGGQSAAAAKAGARSKTAARKNAVVKRSRREVAAAPAQQGQRTLFSPSHAMPATPRPLKKGKR